MGRQKTITDEAVLHVARTIFRDRGHTATTREIAQAAGISEAVLYQRFGSKDELFFAAMRPHGPDIRADPRAPGPAGRCPRLPSQVRGSPRGILCRDSSLGPAEDDASLIRSTQHRARSASRACRSPHRTRRCLASLARRKRLVVRSEAVTARLLVSLAHDWAIGRIHALAPSGVQVLKEMVDVLWEGLRVRDEEG